MTRIYDQDGRVISSASVAETRPEPASESEATFADESFHGELVIYKCQDGWRVYDRFGELLFTAETGELVNRKITGWP